MFKYIILIALFSLETVTKRAHSYDLTEEGLISEIKNSPYGLRQLEVDQYSNEYQNLLTQEKFSAEFYGSGNYAQTKEKSIISFQPIFSPATDLRLGVRKNLQFGVSADASVLTNLKSSDSGATKYDDVSTTTLRFSLVVDLWKDLFGRVSKASLKNSSTDLSLKELHWAVKSIFAHMVHLTIVNKCVFKTCKKSEVKDPFSDIEDLEYGIRKLSRLIISSL
ncbi:MAG: hypothetical protein HOP07_15490 [Bacteriovoracaceae bacterium]|nr:hypothetical protein [Bacteriovoracaceae bacterium]